MRQTKPGLHVLALASGTLMAGPAIAQEAVPEPNVLRAIIEGVTSLQAVAENPAHEVQILYTQIDRTAAGAPEFRSFRWNVNADRYFYPASTVKLPTAALALEKLDSADLLSVNRNSTMLTHGLEKESISNIARFIREIFLVSSNSANNRLFEFVGPVELCDGLQQRGYEKVRIFHRLAVAREPGTITTNAIDFLDGAGTPVHRQLLKTYENRWVMDEPLPKGVAYVKEGVHIDEPKDFSELNAFPLEAQQRLLRALIFPDSIEEPQRLQLSEENRQFLLREMSRWTSESSDPHYDSARFSDAYTKALFFGFEAKRNDDPDIRVFSKSGMAYGTLTDNAYFADFDNRTEFLLSATVLVNANGTFNDDDYEYDSVGIPFLRELGRAVHTYELNRERSHTPDLEMLKFKYSPQL